MDICTIPKCLWRPDPSKETNIDRFRNVVNGKYQLKIDNYAELHQWSIEHHADFWELLWEFASIKYSKTYDKVIDKMKPMNEIPEWFHGSRLNFAENLLKFDDDKVAVYSTKEGDKSVKQLTYKELRMSVAKYAAAMKKMGVQKGDRVVGYIPNCSEAVEAMLAATSIGAIWSSTSPDFGVSGVLDRFSQIQPKLIFSVNAVVYNGKVHSHMEKLESVVQGLPDLEKVIVIPYVVKDGKNVELSAIKHGVLLDDWLATGLENGEIPPLEFEQLPFNHPLYIMYSSGTTGPPKCMVHSAGGTLIKHLEEHVLQGNLSRADVMLYYTTTGWMMWNWLVSVLAVGAAIVCYDGSPLIPGPHVLWDIIDNLGVTVLGTGAKWLSVLEEKDVKPKWTHKLAKLHTILSTGSPLKPVTFEYVYRDIKSDLLLGSITGGTDIIACFAGQNPTVPVYCGEIQSCNLGMAMECWDEEAKHVRGESGELVCTKPFPSMPTSFWNDPNGTKYQKAYFNKFPGVWAHGDYCLISPQTGGIWMLGRSDGTLNPSGVRFGSAEIYHIVENFKEIADTLCVGQRCKDGSEERVVLFIKLVPGTDFTEDLVKRVRQEIRMQLSARHVPAIILSTQDIPYTHSGKKVEVAVKKILGGEDVKIRGAFANPDSLDLYKNIPQLAGF